MPSLTLNNWREGAGGGAARVEEAEVLGEEGAVVFEELDVALDARLLSPGR